jgi:hypothetical protein
LAGRCRKRQLETWENDDLLPIGNELTSIVKFTLRCHSNVREESEIMVVGYGYRTKTFLSARTNEFFGIGFSFSIGNRITSAPSNIPRGMHLKVSFMEMGSFVHDVSIFLKIN